MSNLMYKVDNSSFVIEKLPDGTVLIWDEELEEALTEWVDRGKPDAALLPSPIVASGLTEEEAFDWLKEKLGLDRPYIPVTRIQ